MISSTQREALAVLTELCALSPDIRLGQLMAHLGFLGEVHTERTLWDMDDEQLLAVMYQHRGELVARTTNAPTAVSRPNADVASVSGRSTLPAAPPSAELRG